MAVVYLGLGSNIDPEENLRLGLRELGHRYGKLIISDIYQNAAVGFDGDDFLNLVVGFETDDDPATIHDHIEQIHKMAGRQRNEEGFSARTLDIDLLLYDDLIIDRPGIRIPRPEILFNAFVLKPLQDLAPTLHHPEDGQTYAELWQQMAPTAPLLERFALDL